MMTWYSISVETHGDKDLLTENALAELMDLAEPYDGVISGRPGGRSWSARLSLEAENQFQANFEGMELIGELAYKAGMPNWPFVRTEVVDEAVLDEELERPNLPELVSGAEAADILGVSRQRVHQLRRTHPYFPPSVYELGTGPLWMRSGIEAFNRRWDRVPGRHVDRDAS